MSGEDAFWRIALEDHSTHTTGFDNNGYADSDDDALIESSAISTATFTLVSGQCESITLQLSSLRCQDGVWSPVGANAWFSSALLTELLLDPCKQIEQSYAKIKTNVEKPFIVVELGSGAVGLPGIALGWMLSHRGRCKVVLTDNDALCLKQLHSNVLQCNDLFQKTRGVDFGNLIAVQALDWGEGIEKILVNEAGYPYTVDLVVGSELVYTPITANALFTVIQSIFQVSSDALVVIVQVTDREGWRNIFLPRLLTQSQTPLRVQEKTIPWHVHERANKLFPFGGALDRFDFGVCFISKRDTDGTLLK
jgi:hypothetical protein